jgi:uncharacterized DUF497 family protein
MIFSWDDENREHIAKHAVTPEEAEEVVRGARAPSPKQQDDEKLVVWGATAAGRYLQVIYVLKHPDEVEFDSVAAHARIDIEAGKVREVIRVIHAMDLTPRMKRQLRRRWR